MKSTYVRVQCLDNDHSANLNRVIDSKQSTTPSKNTNNHLKWLQT